MDVVTYCPDTEALLVEVAEKFPELLFQNEDGTSSFLITKTPTVRKGKETLSLVRVDNLDVLNQLNTLQVLGDYNTVFADKAKKKIYNKIYPIPSPVTYTDSQGNEQTYTPDPRFGVFSEGV